MIVSEIHLLIGSGICIVIGIFVGVFVQSYFDSGLYKKLYEIEVSKK